MKLFAKRAIAVITMLALSVGLGFALVACGSSTSSDEKLIAEELDKELGAFKNATAESLAPFVGDDASIASLEAYGIDYVELFQHLFKHFDYSIDSVKVNGDTAVAKLTVQNVDFEKVINEATAAMENDEAFTAELLTAYTSGGEKAMYQLIFQKMYEAIDASNDIVKSEAELQLEKKNGQWEVTEDSMADFASKVYGGMDLSSL